MEKTYSKDEVLAMLAELGIQQIPAEIPEVEVEQKDDADIKGTVISAKNSKLKNAKASEEQPPKKKKLGKIGKTGLVVAIIAMIGLSSLGLNKLLNKKDVDTSANIGNQASYEQKLKEEFSAITNYDELQAKVANAYKEGGWVSKANDAETLQVQTLAFMQNFYTETGKELTAQQAMDFIIFMNIEDMSQDFLINELGFSAKSIDQVNKNSRDVLTVYKIASDGGLEINSMGYATARTQDAKIFAETNRILRGGSDEELRAHAQKYEFDLMTAKHSLGTKVAIDMAVFNINAPGTDMAVILEPRSAECKEDDLKNKMDLFSQNLSEIDKIGRHKLTQAKSETGSVLGMQIEEANDLVMSRFVKENPTLNNAMEAKKAAVQAENDAVNFKIPAGQEVTSSDKITSKPSNGKPGTIDSGKKDYVAPEQKKKEQEGTKTYTDNDGNKTTKDELEGKTTNGQTTKNGDRNTINGTEYEYKDGQWYEVNKNAGKGVQVIEEKTTNVTPQVVEKKTETTTTESKSNTSTNNTSNNTNTSTNTSTNTETTPKADTSTKYTALDGTVFNTEAELIDYVVNGKSK